MKKIAAFLATIVILSILLTACGSSEQCAAYGEYKKYRVESR
jgi:major membrane immunogen (membrane-anchored lipoprotein)